MQWNQAQSPRTMRIIQSYLLSDSSSYATKGAKYLATAIEWAGMVDWAIA